MLMDKYSDNINKRVWITYGEYSNLNIDDKISIRVKPDDETLTEGIIYDLWINDEGGCADIRFDNGEFSYGIIAPYPESVEDDPAIPDDSIIEKIVRIFKNNELLEDISVHDCIQMINREWNI